MHTRPLLALGLLLLVSTPAVSHANVLVSTFGPNNAIGTGSALVTGSGSLFTAFSEADEFTASFAGRLTQIDVAVNLGFNTPVSAGFIDLELAPNNPATNLPLVASALTLGTIQTTSTTPAILSLVPTTNYTFAAGNAYWLILAPHDSTTNTAWDAATNPTAAATASMSATTGGQFTASSLPAAAFRVSATVPEPSTWALLGLGCGLIWWVVPRRRAAL